MSDSPKPRRRWFAFSLRTLFVALTLFGCWLAYEVNWIRQRREFMSHQYEAMEWATAHNYSWPSYGGLFAGPNLAVRAPGLLWLLGERGHKNVMVSAKVTKAEYEAWGDGRWPAAIEEQVLKEVRRVERIFPEADVWYGVVNW